MGDIQIVRVTTAAVVVSEVDFDNLLENAREAQQLAQEIARLRNDLTACQLERDGLGGLIAEHNQRCKMDCEARRGCRRGWLCPDCPQDWRIELPAEPQSAPQSDT